jgi:hypothetical protein
LRRQTAAQLIKATKKKSGCGQDRLTPAEAIMQNPIGYLPFAGYCRSTYEKYDKQQVFNQRRKWIVKVKRTISQWRTQKFSKEGALAAYFSNFTAWLME